MRQIGTLPDEESARRFEDYVLTQGIQTNVDADDGQWAVWVYEEDAVEQAREELDRFQQTPTDPKYVDAHRAAEKLRAAERERVARIRKQAVNVREKWNRPITARAPLTMLLILASVAVGIMTRMDEERDEVHQALAYVSTDSQGMYYLFVSPRNDLRRGQIWRMVTPIFLHFGPLHLLFNMMWLFQLGAAIEMRKGTLRYIVLILLVAIISNTGQYIATGPSFGGMSGVVFGLFGYIWMKGKYDPEDGLFMPPNLVFWMLAWFFLCFTGAVGPIANVAHAGGLITGMLLGSVSGVVRRALRA